jgi:hypothetical protein
MMMESLNDSMDDGKMNQVQNICMHVPNMTLVMLGASLAHLSPSLEIRIK